VSQQDDQSTNVRVISTPGKGFGIVLEKVALPMGAYVGEYVGEILNEDEARQRIESSKGLSHNYLLLFNEHQTSRRIQTFIDARFYGNWTRLINHSCQPNLQVVPVRIDQFEPPHLAFFTLRAIAMGEELSYSYGDLIDTISSKRCHCGSTACKGFMPYQSED
jgi:[histone H3]-lysine36 N-dimethyltransferase SETMAR